MLHPVQNARCQTRMLRQTQQGLSINVTVHTGQHMTQLTGVTSGFTGGQSDGLARRQRDGMIRNSQSSVYLQIDCTDHDWQGGQLTAASACTCARRRKTCWSNYVHCIMPAGSNATGLCVLSRKHV